MKRAMLEHANTVVVLSDHSKFNRQWFSVFALAHEIDHLICNQGGDQTFISDLQDNTQLNISVVG
jgi:DeoR/GlpR family transcriptional regulator of sugar metabolism